MVLGPERRGPSRGDGRAKSGGGPPELASAAGETLIVRFHVQADIDTDLEADEEGGQAAHVVIEPVSEDGPRPPSRREL